MTSVQVLRVILLIIYCFVKFCLGSDEDALYKKFFQTDYKIKFEREMVSYCNRSIMEFNHRMSKYNRTHFGTNATVLFHEDVGNDVEVIVQGFKFLSNEYRIFPIHFEYNACKALKYNVGGIRSCNDACGNFGCPVKKNILYYTCNCQPDESRFPPFMPTGSFKMQLDLIYKDKLIATIESFATVYRPILPGKRFG